MSIKIHPLARSPLPWLALRLIVEAPGERTCENIAADILPPPVLAPPAWVTPSTSARGLPIPVFSSIEELRERRAVWAAHARRSLLHRAEARHIVARALSRLGEAGYIAPCAPRCFLSRWARRYICTRGPGWALSYLRDGPAPPRALLLATVEAEGEAGEELSPAAGPAMGAALRVELLARLAARPLPPRELLGATPSGALQRAYAELAEAGAIHTPSHRWPSFAGRQLYRELGPVQGPGWPLPGPWLGEVWEGEAPHGFGPPRT